MPRKQTIRRARQDAREGQRRAAETQQLPAQIDPRHPVGGGHHGGGGHRRGADVTQPQPAVPADATQQLPPLEDEIFNLGDREQS